MSKFKLGKKSLAKLEGLHPDLKAVVLLAIQKSEVDFTVGEGVRTKATQLKYVRIGASKTMRSRHIPESNLCKLGCAVDLWALHDLDHDGDLDISWVEGHYKPIAKAMKAAATELGIKIEWGIDLWGWDAPHFQLPWREYP
jgi:peptidoglycan L-alanyl-D-glutamate endopeptidase CwlK